MGYTYITYTESLNLVSNFPETGDSSTRPLISSAPSFTVGPFG